MSVLFLGENKTVVLAIEGMIEGRSTRSYGQNYGCEE
jgi:hypothetical protein